MSVKYTIGYNHDLQIFKLLEIFKRHVESVYFPAPYSLMASGRALPQKKGYADEIKAIIESCSAIGIKPQLLLNPTCEGKETGSMRQIKKIVDYVDKLHKEGLKEVVASNPMHIREIKKSIPSISVHSSVNCYVKDAEHAVYLREMGADVITIDRDINRDLDTIRDIKKATGAKIKVLLNEGCLRNCPFRKSHFNMISHLADTEEFDRQACITLIRKHPEKVFSIPFIRPEDIRYYEGIADQFKLATRGMPTMRIALMLEAYAERKFNGNLLDLLSTKALFEYFNRIDNKILTKNDFFEKMTRCKNDCSKCGFCTKLMQEACSINKKYKNDQDD